jgi:uncharacterized protein
MRLRHGSVGHGRNGSRSNQEPVMNGRLFALTLALFLAPLQANAQQRPPIIDMHVHAIAADRQGPPPRPMCAPFVRFPTLDPAEPYRSEYQAAWIRAPEDAVRRHCADVVWSERSDEEVMRRTIAVMERRNVVGVLTGTPEGVAAWMAAAPGRFIPALEFSPATAAAVTPDSLRQLAERGAVTVFGEVENQYAGIAPDDEILAPYWALAEELDLPLGIHIGAGPPGAAAVRSRYLARLSSARTLEPVLVRAPAPARRHHARRLAAARRIRHAALRSSAGASGHQEEELRRHHGR